MTKLKDKLQFLLSYYAQTRQVGHTSLLKEGFDNYGYGFVLSGTLESSKHITKDKKKVVPLSNLDKLRGQKAPLAIDNHAMVILLSEICDELDRLEGIEQKFNEIKWIVND